MKKYRLSKLLACVLCFAIIFLLPVTAFSAQEGSLSINFHNEKKSLSGADFSIYYVAVQTESGKYKYSDAFAKYPVSSPDGLDDDSMMILANTLYSYALRDNIAPLRNDKTNEHGGLRFSGLNTGLYLVAGDTFTEGNDVYIPQPVLVSIPEKDSQGNPAYDVSIEPKYELRNSAQPVERRVLKIWDDDKNPSKRPSNITVQLLKNGDVFDEVVLNEKSNWRYTWENLDASYNWTVTEKTAVKDYVVAVQQQGVTFTVTNSYIGDPPKKTTEKIPSNPKKTSGNRALNNPNSPEHGEKDSVKADKNLPQTGQLWWPVPVMLGAGVVFIFIGIVLHKRSKKENG